MALVRIRDLQGPKEEVADFVDRATLLSQLYDDSIEADDGDGHLRAPGIHASEISKCERKIVYNILDTPKKKGGIKKVMRQRFQVGKYLHTMLQRDFHQMANNSGGRIQFDSEVPVSPKYQALAAELNIQSSCDGVFTFRDEPYGPAVLRVGLEIKTESPDQYEKLKAPRPDHIEQAHVYMKCLDLPLFYFMYFNKGNQNNTSSIGPFLIQFDQVLWDMLERRCRKALASAEAVAAKQQEVWNTERRTLTMAELREVGMPDRKEGMHCEFCPYSETCQPQYLTPKGNGGSARWQQPRRL